MTNDPSECARFREVFDRAGYNQEAVAATFGPVSLPAGIGPDTPHLLHLTRGGTPLETLLRLFLLGLPVEPAVARRALAPAPLEDWMAAGLIALGEDGAARATVRIQPWHGVLLAADHQRAAEACDQVMGITASTTILLDFAVRRPVASTLDLGTGSGVQAFFAARHSQAVCATDVSARALQFARFNAAFNGISHVEFLQGDALAPVRGRNFDLVLTNPPFAITPSQRYLYRDSGLGLDHFVRGLIREVPQMLNEGGLCQLTCDWAHLAGRDWKERLAEWFEGSGCDVWVMKADTHDAAEYAHAWVRDTEHAAPADKARQYSEWIAYYEREKVEAISSGLVAMRRNSSGRNWLRIEDAPDDHSAAFGEAVLRGFAQRDYLERTNGEALLEEPLRVSPDVRVEQVWSCGGQGWQVQSARIRLERGLQYSGNLDRRLLPLVKNCDGRRTVRELLAELAAGMGAGFEQVAPACLPLLRELVERGFLVPQELQAASGPGRS